MSLIFTAALLYAFFRLDITLYEAILGIGLWMCVVYLEYVVSRIKDIKKILEIFCNSMTQISKKEIDDEDV